MVAHREDTQGTIVVKADAHGDRDSCRAVSGAHKECISEFICRSGLAHHWYRETARVQCVSRASGQAHDTAHAFLNEKESQALDMNRSRRVFAFGHHVTSIAHDPPDYIRLGVDA
jgi:hypothetical protein